MAHTVDDYPLAGKNVLFAEDEDRLRTIVTMMLEELGARVVSVADGAAAIEQYQSAAGKFDIVLMDMRMTGLSGTKAFERLTELDPGVKVVLSSGVSPEQDLVDKLIAKRGGFIEKPFNLDRLSDVLTRVLGGESVISSM